MDANNPLLEPLLTERTSVLLFTRQEKLCSRLALSAARVFNFRNFREWNSCILLFLSLFMESIKQIVSDVEKKTKNSVSDY